MPALIYGALAWAMAGLIPTLLLGAGLAIVTYVGLSPLVEAGLDAAVSKLTGSGLPDVALQLALLSGLGEALSIIGSAILTRLAISAAANVAGLKKV